MINRIVLIGRMVSSPEIKYTQSGIAVARLNVAVERSFKNASGDKQTDFINVVVWRKLAELCYQYLEKSQMVGIEGSLQMQQWEKDGQKRTSYEVLADNVQFLSRPGKGDSEGKGASGQPTYEAPPIPSDNDIPEDGLPF